MKWKIDSINKGYVIAFDDVNGTVDVDLIHAYSEYLSKIEGVVDLIPAYNSIGVIFHYNLLPAKESIIKLLNSFSINKAPNAIRNDRIFTIDVCYDTKFGPDIEVVAKHCKVSCNEVVALHTQEIYTVAMIGFLPGFTYLSGLNPILNTPRKNTPTKKILKSSVAIGGNQTGIYPFDSPGGWQIIGKATIDLFNVKNTPPNLFSVGDKIRFNPVTEADLIKYE